MLKNILERESHEIIVEAENGEEAIRLFKEHQPDLVTMDLTMPIIVVLMQLKKVKS